MWALSGVARQGGFIVSPPYCRTTALARASRKLAGSLPPTTRLAIAVFARAPLPGKAKTRLIPLLGRGGAAEFHRVLTADALRKVAKLQAPLARYLFLAGRRSPALPSYPCFQLKWQQGADLGERLQRAFRFLLRRHACAVIIGTDSPTLPARVLREALAELCWCDSVLGPCPDGGYYLIGLRRLSCGIFRGIRWGSLFAFRDTLRNLLALHFSCSILERHADIDRPRDVIRLREELRERASLRRLAPATWSFLRSEHPSAKSSKQS